MMHRYHLIHRSIRESLEKNCVIQDNLLNQISAYFLHFIIDVKLFPSTSLRVLNIHIVILIAATESRICTN